MNNLRLLTATLAVSLASTGVCAYASDVVTLEEIFEMAERNSVQLRPIATSIEEAEKDIAVAKSERLPDITSQLNFSFIGDGFTTKRDLSDLQKAPIPHFGNGLSVKVNQPLYTGGAISSAIELAELKATAARFADDFNRDNIRFRLTGYYLDIYRYENLRQVVEANLDAALKVLEEMNARFEQGIALKNDITRYELLVSNLKLELIRIDNTLTILNNNLVTTAGFDPGTVIKPDSTILLRSLPMQDEGWWQTEAEANSPGIALARTGVELSKTGEKMVKSERLPKIGVEALWTLDGPILVEVPPINRNLSYWYVGVGINYNLASLYKSNKALAKSQTATRRAMEELDATRENVALSVQADYIRYLEAYEELKTRTKSLELAEQNYDITSTRYSADMALITDLLDAANARLESGQQLVNSRINIIYYYYKLLFTSGKI